MKAHDRLIELRIADVQQVLQNDVNGEATRTLMRRLREAATPLSVTLRDSLSREDHLLSRELADCIAMAERALSCAWQELHGPPAANLQF
jgi:hypothetical protein